MRPLKEQRILVTGATAGLGKEVARELADRGATVLLHGRSQPRVAATIAEIAQATGSNRVVPLVADLASLGAIRGLAEEVAAEDAHLDALSERLTC